MTQDALAKVDSFVPKQESRDVLPGFQDVPGEAVLACAGGAASASTGKGGPDWPRSRESGALLSRITSLFSVWATNTFFVKRCDSASWVSAKLYPSIRGPGPPSSACVP